MSEPLWAVLVDRAIGFAQWLWDRTLGKAPEPVKPARPTDRRTTVELPEPIRRPRTTPPPRPLGHDEKTPAETPRAKRPRGSA